MCNLDFSVVARITVWTNSLLTDIIHVAKGLSSRETDFENN